jgi:hypothetical protein
MRILPSFNSFNESCGPIMPATSLVWLHGCIGKKYFSGACTAGHGQYSMALFF